MRRCNNVSTLQKRDFRSFPNFEKKVKINVSRRLLLGEMHILLQNRTVFYYENNMYSVEVVEDMPLENTFCAIVTLSDLYFKNAPYNVIGNGIYIKMTLNINTLHLYTVNTLSQVILEIC